MTWHHVKLAMKYMSKTAYSDLDLRELRVLDVLLRECSITRTAQALETTQPAVSKMLRHLREQFSDPLIVRNGHAMQPTAKALEMTGQLRALLDAADGLRADAVAFNPRTSDRMFSLLLTDVGMIRFLPPLIAAAAAVAPGVSLRAVPLDSREFELKLETGEADLALGAFPQAAGYLRRQRLFSDGYLSVIRKRHPRLSKARSRAGFLEQRHILITASETGHAAHGEAHHKPTALRLCPRTWRTVSPAHSGWWRSRRRSRCRGSRSPSTGTSVTIATPPIAGSGH